MNFNTDHTDAELFELAVSALDANIADIEDDILNLMNGQRDRNVELMDKLTRLIESRKHIIDLAQRHLPPW